MSDIEFDENDYQVDEAFQVLDTPSLNKIFADKKGLKFLFKGIMQVTDLIVIVLDAFDCDFRKNKIAKIIKQNFSKREE